jgi:membrane-associated phospholipid phosphatase
MRLAHGTDDSRHVPRNGPQPGSERLRLTLLPRGFKDALLQLALFGATYALYDLVRGLVNSGNSYKPFGDAMRIIDVERVLHVFVEPAIQGWTENTHWLMDAADWSYLNAHYVVTAAVLVFIYLRRNESYGSVRNTFIIAMLIGLIGYALYPTAPPRLMPEWGFTDSISQFLGSRISIDDGPGKAFLNFYAAVPSIHVCFAVITGVSMMRLCRHRLVRIAWCLYPLWVAFVVVATGNHFLTDVLLGVLTAGASALIAQRLARWARPRAAPWVVGAV